MTHEGLDSQSHDASTEVFRAGEDWVKVGSQKNFTTE